MRKPAVAGRGQHLQLHGEDQDQQDADPERGVDCPTRTPVITPVSPTAAAQRGEDARRERDHEGQQQRGAGQFQRRRDAGEQRLRDRLVEDERLPRCRRGSPPR